MMKNEFLIKNRAFSVYYGFIVVIQSLFSLFLGGENCLCCSKRTLRIPLCKKCLKLFLNTDFTETCTVCGRELISEINLCSHCKEEQILKNLDGCFSIHSYQLWKKSLLFSWKLQNKRALSFYFAALIYKKLEYLKEKTGLPLTVVPVPPRKGKIREKGWDQIEEICFYLEKAWNIKVTRLLTRLSHIQQKKLDRFQRIEGISLSYTLKSRKKISKLIPKMEKNLVIIDDVLTTGSTIEACARNLKELGVEKVYSITLFIVD